MIKKEQKQWTLKFKNSCKIGLLFLCLCPILTHAQCLSSVNPVGGTNNMLVLEKNSLRVITFYKYGGGNQYFEGSKHTEFDLIKRAYYNYLATTISYGVTNKFTIEVETGYFINKSQIYNLAADPNFKLKGNGMSNMVFLAKHSLFTEPVKRIYVTGALGAKIPWSRNYQWKNGVQLPVEIQPTMGAFGAVFNLNIVKESPGNGMRYFFISRAEINGENKYDYKLGQSFYNSIYVSKHLMFPWLKGDWTAILQLRNEIRTHDKESDGSIKDDSGSTLFFISPQINHYIKEKWNLSAMVDIPVYQNFNGTQLGAGTGFTFVLSRTFSL